MIYYILMPIPSFLLVFVLLSKKFQGYGLVASYHFSFKGEVTYLVFVFLFVLLLIRDYMTFHVHL